MNDQRTLLAWAYLSRVVEPPCAALAAYVAAVGPVEAAARIRRGDEEEELTPFVDARREQDCAATDVAMLQARGGRLITPGDDEWPLLALVAFGSPDVRKKERSDPPLVNRLETWMHDGVSVFINATPLEDTATFAAWKDTDEDGMPDAWETTHKLNPNDPTDRNADADQDGYTNLEEYLNNTDPGTFVDYRHAGP